MTAEIRSAIKKRKHLNRNKRSSKENEKDTTTKQYIEQKKLVQTLVYEAIQTHEAKIANDIKMEKDGSYWTILTNSEENQRKENKNVHYTIPIENN